MVVGAIADEVITLAHKGFGHGLRIFNDLLAIRFELVGEYFAKRYGFGCDHVLQWSALHARENSQVEQGAHRPDISFRILDAIRIIKIMPQHNDTATGT